VQPTFADLDGDGDQDLIIGRSYSCASGCVGRLIEYYENVGTATNPDFETPTQSPLPVLTYPPANNPFIVLPTFGDIDNDGDLDLLIGKGNNTGDFEFFENVGTATNPDFGSIAIINFTNGKAPVFFDINLDGYADLFIGNNSNYPNQVPVDYYENNGTGGFNPAVTLSTTGLSAALPAIGDLNLDGYADVIIAEWSNDIQYYTGDVNGNYTLQSPLLSVTESGHLALVDIDADGDLDLFIGQENNLAFYKNYDPTASTNDLVNNRLTVYPNPVKNMLNMQSKIEIKQLEIYNMTGKIVLCKTNTNKLNIANLDNGLYFLKTTFIDGKTAINKIIKN
jgi:hypothetical protein